MSIPDTSAGSTPESAAPKPESGGLQFDRAEYSKPKSITCSTCNQPVQSTYYKINGNNVCEPCRNQIEAHITGGSGARRFIRATVFGTIAGAIGSGIYYAILAATGYEIGLIAILVGFMVGTAVKNGSDGRGGLVYQLLAVFLTYTAIVSSYVPIVISQIRQQNSQQNQSVATSNGAANKNAKAPITQLKNDTAKASPVSAPVAEPDNLEDMDDSGPSKPVGFVGAIIAIVLLIALMYALPFLAGLQNIIGLLIIGFGLYQAWQINARMAMQIKGPFNVSPGNQGAQPTGA